MGTDTTVGASRWWRVPVVLGLVAMLVGALDPLEGALIILPATAVVALGAWLRKSRHRLLLYGALALVALGVGALWGLSAVGGFGGSSGRSMWWGALLLPYPAGWILGLVGAVRVLREPSVPSTPP